MSNFKKPVSTNTTANNITSAEPQISGEILQTRHSQNLKEWLEEDAFSLSLSSGFFSFFAHLGMLSVLEDEQLIPKHISGSSAGALIGSLWAAGLSCQTIARELFSLQRIDFWDPDMTLGFRMRSKNHTPGLLKGGLFRNRLAAITKPYQVNNIEDCPIPLHLSVHCMESKSTVVFDTGSFANTVYASCAFPGLFQAMVLEHPNGGSARFNDGGILDRPALAGYRQTDERIFYHHISSRSPWRKKDSPSLRHPQRPNLSTLSLNNISRCGPTKLHLGPQIFSQARAQTQYALSLKPNKDTKYGFQ
jgi:NTE family protein